MISDERARSYRRQIIEHNDEVHRLLAATTDGVRRRMRAYRLDLYPIGWVRERVAQFEREEAAAVKDPRKPPFPPTPFPLNRIIREGEISFCTVCGSGANAHHVGGERADHVFTPTR